MPKYRRKPIVVEAVKITRPMTIDTVEGAMTGNPGDYLITDSNGEQYPCPASEFDKVYEPMSPRFDVKTFLVKSYRKVKRKSKEIILSK
ncbi:PGDYG domain-containing protein [Evansella tamaricis]|uniref:PGDYG domain-containing protein n=1 Tax=Evansella tamaricis TaxID=2069301 RepID=A0ABS6JDX4_9BACI|nr:PGDYG domain-containing protein [Evansella tamaricis]MBU9711776.1 PGDYG domain-containing protein [Evansella tamaricis]